MSPKLPPVLYRYRPWSVFESEGKERKPVEEISSRYAFFSSPLRLNDPQDSLLGPEFTGGKEDRHRLLNHAFADTKRLMQKQRCQVSGLDENDPEYKDAVALYRRGEKRKKSCVCCFSRDWNNPLLWTFYAQEHHGFCLGYSTSGSLLGGARPVLYTHSPMDVLHLEDPEANNDQLSFCKSTDWQFENEWRVSLPEPGPKQVSLAAEKLISVHVGYRMKDVELQELAAALRKTGHRPEDTKLFRIERVHMSFALDQKPVGY